MPKIKYKEIKFHRSSLDIITAANAIIDDYKRKGFELTLRQLYYQFVSRDLIQNKDTEYKRLGEIISDGRLAGLIDWRAIIDRTRNLSSYSGDTSPEDALATAAGGYGRHQWEDQPNYVEVWVEKDALIGVVRQACQDMWTPHFSCRGYTSASEMWTAAQRLAARSIDGGQTVVIHLGDHDPSGMDMTRDIEERLSLFAGREIEVRRIALNMAQIEELKPPPNPAKITDSRAGKYIAEYGRSSWELDAIEPGRMVSLIRGTVRGYVDEDILARVNERSESEKAQLMAIARNYDEVCEAFPVGEDDD